MRFSTQFLILNRKSGIDSDFSEVNIGNPDEVTMLQLAEEILAMVPTSKSKIVFEALPQDDPRVRQPDITLAKSLLGWEPHVQRAEGLKRTLKYFDTAVRQEGRQ